MGVYRLWLVWLATQKTRTPPRQRSTKQIVKIKIDNNTLRKDFYASLMKESISGSLEVDNDAVHLRQVEENLRPVDFSQVLDGVDHAMEGESVAVEGESVVAGDESVTHVEDRAYSNEDKEGRLTSLSRFISRIFFLS